MDNKDLNKQFEAFKRQAADVVRDMHARRLAIPAAALLLAIVAAIVLLPSAAEPVPAPAVAAAPTVTENVERVARVSLIEPSSVDEDAPLTSSSDPFTGSGGYNCTKISSDPKTFNCKVADLLVRVVCTSGSPSGPCAETAGGGSTGAAGGASKGGSATPTGGSGGSGSGGSGGNSGGGTGGGSGGSNEPAKTTIYEIEVSIGGTTKKNVQPGTQLPSSSSPIVAYAGTNDAHDKAAFVAPNGVKVDGAKVDSTLGSFYLSAGQTVTLTDSSGKVQKLTLKSISKVTK